MRRFRPRVEELPGPLAPLVDLITDLRWTWSHAGDRLWEAMDPDSWAVTENPYVILQNLPRGRLESLAGDARFLEHLRSLTEARDAYRARPGWFSAQHGDAGLRGVAYFSMEFGLGEALPLYAGGLGVLAGDHLKSASDLGLPLVGVGLLYQEGYFHQVLDADGRQLELYPYNDTTTLPVEPVEGPDGAWLWVPIHLPGRTLRLRAWKAQVGRIPLYLLDSNDPLNMPADRGITGKLYGGGAEQRLLQEIALGIGGWRLIEALALEVDVCHLNEGHAAFVTLERARAFMERHGVDLREALWATRPGNVFTTHTPVAAAFDTYDYELLDKYARHYAERLGVPAGVLAALGRVDGDDDHELFNMAWLAARTCGSINGVSRLHGEVSRAIFQPLYPDWPRSEVPVGHVTNGVHVPSWDSAWADALWTEACGKDRWLGHHEPLEEPMAAVDDATLWELRGRQRADLVHRARTRLHRQLAQRGEADVAVAGEVLDPNILTIGFARRFTDYKRPNLLLRDPERLARLLNDPDRPMQVIVAGKAHPDDALGKRYVRAWARFAQQPGIRRRVVFMEDYDIALAQELVQGVDVWINTPRRPWEASGTSGMKVLVNGGLNLSSLDGWWAEAWEPEVGWALGDNRPDVGEEEDARDAEALYRLLEAEVVPAFYDLDEAGIPRAWVTRMRASMARLAPRFSTNRMVQEYVESHYLPAAREVARRSADNGAAGRNLQAWSAALRHDWDEIHWGQRRVTHVEDGWEIEIQVYLGDLPPDAVAVEIYADPDPEREAPAVRQTLERDGEIPGASNGYRYRGRILTDRPAEHFTPRVVPWHPDARVPAELGLLLWWRE